jgi:23S rRNA U2552 (ribose-2'-O)-methylase RlmE/FtsJ
MSYYQLFTCNNIIYPSRLICKFTNDENENKIFLSNTLHSYVMNSKEKIDKYERSWDKYKKYINPYEFIHTMIPDIKHSIAKYKPLSRSYFKFIEIAQMLKLLDDYTYNNINTFHLAEGPGGFIEALCHLRKNQNDNYIGMTLIDDSDTNVPGWKKTQNFLNKNKNVTIDYGITKNGDLLDPKNFVYVNEKYKNSMDIITGDGGFDFSIDFNQQESISFKLIYVQMCYALIMQKYKGHFFLKIFDSFSLNIIQLLYILNNLYEKVYIVKPNTSRYANSERYIVCKHFRLTDSSNLFYPLLNNISQIKNYKYITSIYDEKLNYYFIIKMEEINAAIGQQQIDYINSTIELIENNNEDKITRLVKNNIQKCTNWCIKYKIPYIKINTEQFEYNMIENEFI